MTTKNYDAGGTINPYRIVKFDADYSVVQGAAATDLLVGVADIPPGGTIASGERCDVQHDGVALMEAGGTIARGAKITSDANGKAVAAAPAAGVNNEIIGIALQSAVSGDIFYGFIAPSTMQGA